MTDRYGVWTCPKCGTERPLTAESVVQGCPLCEPKRVKIPEGILEKFKKEEK